MFILREWYNYINHLALNSILNSTVMLTPTLMNRYNRTRAFKCVFSCLLSVLEEQEGGHGRDPVLLRDVLCRVHVHLEEGDDAIVLHRQFYKLGRDPDARRAPKEQ
jgi:hypothetical protein